MTDTYSIGDIAAAQKEKTRTIQFWSDMGVLHPVKSSNRKGKGTHRRFDETELRIAGLAKRLAAMNCPVGELVSICNFARTFTVADLVQNAYDLYDTAQKMRSNKHMDIFSVIETYYQVISLAGVAGFYTGRIQLIINYYIIDGDVATTSLFFPEGQPGDILSRKRKENYIGYKSIAVDVERDLRFRYSPNEEERTRCEQIMEAAIKAVTEILDEVEQPSEPKA